jgi:ApaG protein
MAIPGRDEQTRASISAYEAVTRGVVVRVSPAYNAEQSDAARGRYAFAYTVDIENRSVLTVQLLTRHWIITDGNGRVEEIKGDGVVGHQPTLRPGEGFRYTSGCPLTTPSGGMEGAFGMVTEGGEAFDARVPPFSLHSPDAARRPS